MNQPCGPDRTIFHQVDILAAARRINLGKSRVVNATLQYEDSGSKSCFFLWSNDRMVAAVKHAGFLCKGEEATEKDNHKQLLDKYSTKYWHVQ